MKRQRIRVATLVCAFVLAVSLPASATPWWVTGEGGGAWWGEVQRAVAAWWESISGSEAEESSRQEKSLEDGDGDVVLFGTQDGETCRPWETEQSCSIDPNG